MLIYLCSEWTIRRYFNILKHLLVQCSCFNCAVIKIPSLFCLAWVNGLLLRIFPSLCLKMHWFIPTYLFDPKDERIMTEGNIISRILGHVCTSSISYSLCSSFLECVHTIPKHVGQLFQTIFESCLLNFQHWSSISCKKQENKLADSPFCLSNRTWNYLGVSYLLTYPICPATKKSANEPLFLFILDEFPWPFR